MEPAATIKQAFDQAADDYDRLRRQLIPCFGDFYGAAIGLLQDGLGPGRAGLAPPAVLDLGAGTGLLSAAVAAALPAVRLTLLDISDAMLAVARRRFAASGPAVAFRAADYREEDLGGPYDAIVSALSIHHLPDEGKRALFGRCRAALVPGGVFVDAEQVRGETAAIEAACRTRWLREMRRRGITEEQLAAALERMRHDRPATLEAQLGWLRAAGFVAVECRYKNGNFAVFGGRRPGPGCDGAPDQAPGPAAG